MTDDELAAIRARALAAPAERLGFDDGDFGFISVRRIEPSTSGDNKDCFGEEWATVADCDEGYAYANLFCNARRDILWLIEEVERLRRLAECHCVDD